MVQSVNSESEDGKGSRLTVGTAWVVGRIVVAGRNKEKAARWHLRRWDIVRGKIDWGVF